MCNHRIFIKLKGKFCRTTIQLAMLYGFECCAVKKQHIHKLGVIKMRTLR